jgi:hypothetical protein
VRHDHGLAERSVRWCEHHRQHKLGAVLAAAIFDQLTVAEAYALEVAGACSA